MACSRSEPFSRLFRNASEGIGRGADSGLLASPKLADTGWESGDAKQGALTSMPSSSADAERGLVPRS
jgi:hypothetical protein